jgi:hypothetical protein
MKPPTLFSKMRRNRTSLNYAREHWRIADESAQGREHIREQAASSDDTQAWWSETPQEPTRSDYHLAPRRPSLLRRWINYACGLGESA